MSKNVPENEMPKRAAVIPPSPSKADYTGGDDYAAQIEANAVPIFEREDLVSSQRHLR